MVTLVRTITDAANVMHVRHVPRIERRVTVQAKPTRIVGALTCAGQEVFVQQGRPSEPGPWIWMEIDGSGQPLDLVINDGED